MIENIKINYCAWLVRQLWKTLGDDAFAEIISRLEAVGGAAESGDGSNDLLGSKATDARQESKTESRPLGSRRLPNAPAERRVSP